VEGDGADPVVCRRLFKRRSEMNAGIAYALVAAILFGASTPLAKMLIDTVSANMLAGLLYLSSGVALASWRIFIPSSAKFVQRGSMKWLVLSIFFGGLIAPVLLMLGLQKTGGAGASLMLNLENVFTALIAWFIFKENFDRRLVLGMVAIVTGGALLSYQWTVVNIGSLFVALACVCWSLDNNFTRNISGEDPVWIAALKGLVAGSANVIIALCIGSPLPQVKTILAAAGIGVVGYGISLCLFVLALRHIGTARTSAYFSLAPFVGAAIAIPLLHESITTNMLVAAALMACGVYVHLTERHEHEHVHEMPNGEIIVHTHPHYPDIDHRHEH
jgi:drug/metabolite transporter (DMT)-like permease